MPEQSTVFNTWAIVEVMGHKRFAGFVTEQSFGIAALIRVDVPETEQPAREGWVNGRWGNHPARTTARYSKLIGVGSIYCITPCTEEVARKVATVIEADNDPIPVALPVERQIPASTGDAAPFGAVSLPIEEYDSHDDKDEEAEVEAEVEAELPF
jgi:hypothetical protein